VLLDEINRSSAKTQSAMLEAMQERQTTIGGEVHRVPRPFLVIATQNPIEQEGTYELPEAQMDQFLLKEIVEYPSPPTSSRCSRASTPEPWIEDRHAETTISLADVEQLQDIASRVYVDPAIRNYIVSLVYVTRNPVPYIGETLGGYIKYGASPRGSIAFLQASRARAARRTLVRDPRGRAEPAPPCAAPPRAADVRGGGRGAQRRRHRRRVRRVPTP
jgi:MoxR-like ATPase